MQVPSGGVYLTAPFNLTSNQELFIDSNARILGTTNRSLIPLMKPFPSMGGVITRDGYPCRYGPLVGAFNATNISIVGTGGKDASTSVIDGQGDPYWYEGG